MFDSHKVISLHLIIKFIYKIGHAFKFIDRLKAKVQYLPLLFYETRFRKVDAFLVKVKTFQLYIYNINLICALNKTFSRDQTHENLN